MTKTVFIVGNDGSGKSTYVRRMQNASTLVELPIVRRHYYSHFVRRLFRVIIDKKANISGRKETYRHATPPRNSEVTDETVAQNNSSSVKKRLLKFFLLSYQIAMACETWLRDILQLRGLLVYDRSHVDDLISISEVLKIGCDDRMLRLSAKFFPCKRLYFLSAGHREEYQRIEVNDLSPEMHQAKGESYETAICSLEASGLPIKRINTSCRGRNTATTQITSEGKS